MYVSAIREMAGRQFVGRRLATYSWVAILGRTFGALPIGDLLAIAFLLSASHVGRIVVKILSEGRGI